MALTLSPERQRLSSLQWRVLLMACERPKSEQNGMGWDGMKLATRRPGYFSLVSFWLELSTLGLAFHF